MCNVIQLVQLLVCLGLIVVSCVEGSSFRYRRQSNGKKGKECPNRGFRCKSGECIGEEKECDGAVDCPDASDETNACHRIKCPPYSFRCKYGACINADFICDGKPDCRDTTDETLPQCTNTTSTNTCKAREFRCNSGECISEDFKCDGTTQCKDRSDETAIACWDFKCPGFTYKCTYGACVSGDAQCNGIVECYDGSDEDPNICKQIPSPTTPSIETPIIKPQGNDCVLPPHPEFGRWEIYRNFSNYEPGMSVGLGTVLQVNCKHGYKLEGNPVVLCREQGQWSSPIGQCLKLCPPIVATTTMKVTCIFKGRETENCTEPIDGTLAKYECNNFYEDLNLANKKAHICRDGSWNQQRPVCVPVCGQKSVSAQTLIVNGSNVKKGDYPWQVALYTKHDKNLICGGSLLSQKVILTAAHCITDEKGKKFPKDLYIVAVGKYYRKYDDPRDASDVQFSELEEMFVSEFYQGFDQNYLGDIAVLVTRTTFILSKRVQPVCVDWGLNFINASGSARGYVTGWGYTKENSSPSEELKEISVPPVNLQKCQQGLPEDYNIFLTYDKICAGFLDKRSGVCRGDSGGGLVFKHRDRYYITGIVSLSPQASEGGCDSQQYGLYTNVYKYVEKFIFNIESKYSPKYT